MYISYRKLSESQIQFLQNAETVDPDKTLEVSMTIAVPEGKLYIVKAEIMAKDITEINYD